MNILKRLREFYEERGEIRKIHLVQSYDAITHDFLVKRNISSGNKALDLVCGDGYYLRDLSPKFNEVIGIDISQSSVRQARKRMRDDNIYLIIADACKLPLRNDALDFILCSEVIEHLINPSEVILEMKRCLYMKGKMLITTPNRLEPTRFLYYGIAEPLLRRIVGLNTTVRAKASLLLIHNKLSGDNTGIERLSLKYSIPDHFHCFSVKQLKNLCIANELKIVKLDYSMHHPLLLPIIRLANEFPQLMKICFYVSKLIPKQVSIFFR